MPQHGAIAEKTPETNAAKKPVADT